MRACVIMAANDGERKAARPSVSPGFPPRVGDGVFGSGGSGVSFGAASSFARAERSGSRRGARGNLSSSMRRRIAAVTAACSSSVRSIIGIDSVCDARGSHLVNGGRVGSVVYRNLREPGDAFSSPAHRESNVLILKAKRSAVFVTIFYGKLSASFWLNWPIGNAVRKSCASNKALRSIPLLKKNTLGVTFTERINIE
jgi:hypothetical protein